MSNADGTIKIDSKIDQKQFEKDLQGMQKKMKGAGDSLKKTGKNLTKYVSAPLIGVTGLAVAAANEIDKAYKNIQIGTGATGDELQELHDVFDNVFTQVPQGPEEVSNVIADFNTLMGLTGEEAELMSLKVLDASRMMGIDSANLTQQAAEAFNRWGFEGEEAADKMDLVFKASQDTGTSMDQLFSILSKHGSDLEAFGMGFDEAAYFIGEMEKAGYDVNGIMREMRSGLTKLAEDGRDPAESFAELAEEIKGAESATEAAEIASEVFGSRARDVSDAIRSGQFDFENLTDQIGDYENVIRETGEETLTMGERFSIMKNEVMVALEPIGEILMDLAEEWIPRVIEVVQRLAEWWDNLSPAVQNVIMILGLLLVVVGPILSGLGLMVGLMSNLMPIVTGLIKLFTLLLNPWVLIGIVVAALAYLIYKYWDEIKEFIENVFTAISDFIADTWEWIKETFQNALEWIDDITDGTFSDVLDVISDYMDMIWGIIEDIWESIKDTFQNAVDFVVSLVTGDFEGMKDAISNQMDNIRDTIQSIWNRIKDFFSETWDTITNRLESFKDGFINVWESIKDGVRKAISPIIDFINSIIEAIEGMVNAVARGVNSLPSFDIPDFVPAWAGGGSTFGMPEIPNISIPRVPSLDIGTDRVFSDGLAMLHAGEKVVPADVAGGGYSGDGAGVKINIERMEVRDDRDIELIARELERMIKRKKRGRGIIT